jgi:hypothetical protein
MIGICYHSMFHHTVRRTRVDVIMFTKFIKSNNCTPSLMRTYFCSLYEYIHIDNHFSILGEWEIHLSRSRGQKIFNILNPYHFDIEIKYKLSMNINFDKFSNNSIDSQLVEWDVLFLYMIINNLVLLYSIQTEPYFFFYNTVPLF